MLHCGEPLSVHRGSMDVFWCLLLTLLLYQETCDGAEISGAVGRSVTFSLQTLYGKAAAWSHENDVIVTVKFGDPPEATFFDDNYKTRLAFPEKGRALTISQLRMDDAGTYTAKISSVKTTFTLHVYRELAEPTVTCVAQNCSVNSCHYMLNCTASSPGSGKVSYSWSLGDRPQGEGPMVLVEESPLDEQPSLLTCMAQNPVSSRNITVTSPAALCAENTIHSSTTGSYSSRQAGIVAASVVGVGVLLAVVIFVVYSKCKGWRIFSLPAAMATNTEDGAGYMTVYAQVGPCQQAHLQSFPNAQPDNPKKMPPRDVDTSKSIYFTIQATAQTDDEKMGNGIPGR